MLYQILLTILIICVAIVLLLLLRARKIKEKYVWLWLCLDILALISLFLPTKLVDHIASFLGFAYGSSMVFTGVLVMLVITTIQQASAISSLEEERRILVEEIAILHNRIDDIEDKNKEQDKAL